MFVYAKLGGKASWKQHVALLYDEVTALNSIKKIMEQREDLREFLFVRGFLLTDDPKVPKDGYPFYGTWHCEQHGAFYFWTHPKTGIHTVDYEGNTFFLFGHAYNPFTMEADEDKILLRIAEHFDRPDYYDYLDEISGVFVYGVISGENLAYVVDPSGMQSAASGSVNHSFYLTSHPQLVGDLCGLEMDPFVKELVEYKWYRRVMGGYLPTDLTPFADLKRVVPNQAYLFNAKDQSVSHKRFYPLKDLAECSSEEEYRQVIEEAADILRKNMELVLKKWPNAWQSLTGGIDSNTTFAAANGHYDQLHTFSYVSALKETFDRDAAKKISAHFGVPFTEYLIPADSSELDSYEEKAAVINHNDGYVALTPENEIRKRIVLQAECPAEIEIKSWVSETIRAYWYKHYGRKSMPELSGKLFRNLYKIFLFNRGLAHRLDRLFDAYIEEFEYRKIPAQYPPADMHYNEVTWGSWGGMNISQMKFCFDITFIYNNRRFFDLMFKVPLEKRISDQHHLDMKRYLNPELYDMGIRVVNLKETDTRAFLLNCIFTMNTILPF